MRTILIIDDDVAFTAKLKEQLSEAGYRVLNTSIIAQAERECAREHPDLVLLEVRTERDAGWEALPRLAALQPVIVLSSAGLEEDVMRGSPPALPIMSLSRTVPVSCWPAFKPACCRKRQSLHQPNHPQALPLSRSLLLCQASAALPRKSLSRSL